MAAVAQLPAAPPEDSPVEILNNERADTRPTWFNPGQFLELDFDADEYVTGTKRYVPLDVLKKLLDDHLAELKAKLVEVINEDYASFVGLSPKLAPVEGHMLRLRNPLLQLKVKVGDAKGMVSMELEALKDSLSRQQQLADARVTLELMQHTAQCLSKVETLLKELQAAALEDLLAHSRLLERVAGEAGRLHFYLNKGASLQFIQGMRPRIEASCSLLLKHLKQALGTALESDDAVAAGHLLHGFALMQQSEEALAVLRTAAVKPLVQTAFRDAKAAAADGAGGGSSAQLLSVALQAVLEGMKTQLAAVMQLCSTPQAGLGIGALLSGAVLPEVHSVLTQQLPGAFSPGVRASFLESYLSATSFLRSVEARCTTTADVTALRSSAAHAALLKCWNLSVYFSLCFQDIAGALEAALPSSTPPQAATGDEAASSGREGGGAPELQHSRAVVSCVQACLQDDMFLLPLADRFLKLVLQALLRYAACTREAHAWRPREDSGAGAGAAADGADDAGSSAWWLRLSMDQVLQLAADAAKVERDCTQHARTRIAALLQPLEDAPLLQRCLQALDAAAAEVQASGNGLLQLVANELVAQGVMQLKQMKGIAATYRMTSRAAPTRPSPYVMHITRALQAVLQGAAGAQLSAAQQALLVERSAAGLCTQYRALALELLETWRRTESSLRRVKARPGLTASEGSTSPVPGPGAGMSDMDKILLQLSLDVQEFGRQLQELGLGASGMVEFRELLDSVSAPVAGT